MTLNDHITQYNNNHKRFSFILVLKLMISKPIIKPVEKKTINWEASITIINLNQKNTHYIKKEKNQKKKPNKSAKKNSRKEWKKKQYI